MTKEKVMKLIGNAKTKADAKKAIKAYEQYKIENDCIGPMAFSWAEMNRIDKVFEQLING
jgi:hypothetical protein